MERLLAKGPGLWGEGTPEVALSRVRAESDFAVTRFPTPCWKWTHTPVLSGFPLNCHGLAFVSGPALAKPRQHGNECVLPVAGMQAWPGFVLLRKELPSAAGVLAARDDGSLERKHCVHAYAQARGEGPGSEVHR